MKEAVWGTIEPVELSPYRAAHKIHDMLPLIRADITLAVRLYAHLDEGEKLLGEKGRKGSADLLLTASYQSLVLALVRLFEFGIMRRFTQDERDVASIPFLARLLGADHVRQHLLEKAENWQDGLSPQESATAFSDYLDEGFDALFRLERDDASLLTLKELDALRDHRLAHRLILEEGGELAHPSLLALNGVLIHAIDIFIPFEVAITGQDGAYETLRKSEHIAARSFWQAQF